MIYLILALMLFTTVILLGAAASRNANTNLVSMITGIIGGLVPLAVILTSGIKQSFHSQKYGIFMSILCGIAAGLYVMAINKSFTLNKIVIVTPIIFGGTILLTTILSYFIFKEKISVFEGLGLLFVLIGITILIYARAATA